MIFNHKYLDERMLKGIASYRYNAAGYTWLDDLHNPMWNWVVEHLMPVWLAPNLITLSGVLCIVGSHVLLACYAPQLDGANAPWWVHLIGGLGIITYVNLDCMDGKQARRTKSSSALGQLFDHGCDALAVGLMLISVATSANMPLSPIMVQMMFCPLITWILAQWEEYHTGMMLYGNGYFGILEANYALAAVHLISAFVGARFWTDPIGVWLPQAPFLLHQVPIVTAIFFAAVVFMLIQMVGQVYHVYGPAHKMDAAEVGHKSLGGLAATEHLLYFVIYFALSYLFLMQPPHGGVWHSRALLIYVVVTYATIATQLIVAHMAKEAYMPSIAPFLGLVAGAANWAFNIFDSEVFAYTLAAGVIAAYVHYVVCICNQVCAHLDVKCFRIHKKSKV